MYKLKEKINKLKNNQDEIKRILRDTQKLSKTHETLRRSERINKCVICLEYGQFENVMIARQCGHGCFCVNCVVTGNIKNCPTCRVETTFVKLFI